MKSKEAIDHLGHRFKSQGSMAKAYGLEPERLRKRLYSGWDLKRALTTPVKESIFCDPIKAPNGVLYVNHREMCKSYGVPFERYVARVTIRKWSLEDALCPEKKSGSEIPARDHLGKDYPSLSAMARAWNLSPNCLFIRLEAGWTIERALTTPGKKKNKTIKLKSEYDAGLED